MLKMPDVGNPETARRISEEYPENVELRRAMLCMYSECMITLDTRCNECVLNVTSKDQTEHNRLFQEWESML